MNQLTVQWAFSHWKTFKTCPRQYYHKYVAKDIKEEQGEAALYGTAVHKSFEDVLTGAAASMPPEHAHFKPYVDVVSKWPGERYIEHKMAVNFELEPCDFFDPNYFVRGIVDVAVVNGRTARILDWKTGGNAKYAELKQLELMSLLLFKHFPQVERTRCALVFVKLDKLVKADYSRDREREAWANWMYEISRIQTAKDSGQFGPNPNNLCKKWCPVLSCEFNERSA